VLDERRRREGDLREPRAVGLDVHGAVGEEQHLGLEDHHVDPGHGLAGLGADDPEHGLDRIGIMLVFAADERVGVPQCHHRRAEVRRLLHPALGLAEGDPAPLPPLP
jgi:hypothetical protein